MITLTTTCPMSGRKHSIDLPLEEVEYCTARRAWKSGTLIQKAFPTLNADQREFLQSGLHPDIVAAVFDKEDPS